MIDGPTRKRERPSVARYRKLRVAVARGVDTGLVLEAAGERVRVGTALDNDLVLTDDSVSRHHCELEATAAGLRVHDTQGSTNGVVVGQTRLRDATVTGDVDLVLGDTTLAVRWLDEVVDRERTGTERFGDVMGRAGCMRELFAQLERIALTDFTLLIEGETGTGKGVVAESVHAASRRADGPFVVLDCGALSPQIIESELFGHERGAFTGAVAARSGLFEQAHGGTLFVDEIGELPVALQPKLLRVLESGELRRVGGSRTLRVDARVVCATNRNLRAEVARGGFREDLYYRLAIAHVRVPPLRDRLDDIELLADHFMALDLPERPAVPEHVWALFRAHRWPGNVRELRNAIRRLALSPERPLTGFHARPAAAADPSSAVLPLREARRQATDDFESEYLDRVLSLAGGNVTRAAALAQVSRQMMQRLMRKHDKHSG